MPLSKRPIGDSCLFALITFVYLESFRQIHLRKRVIGDLYMASSLIFIYLAFLYFGFSGEGLAFLVIGLVIGLFGMKTKKVMIEQELKAKKK